MIHGHFTLDTVALFQHVNQLLRLDALKFGGTGGPGFPLLRR